MICPHCNSDENVDHIKDTPLNNALRPIKPKNLNILFLLWAGFCLAVLFNLLLVPFALIMLLIVFKPLPSTTNGYREEMAVWHQMHYCHDCGKTFAADSTS